MSEETRQFLKNANVGLAVAAAILIVGFWPTHRSEVAYIALGFTAFIVAMAVFAVLNIRYERTQRKGPPHS